MADLGRVVMARKAVHGAKGGYRPRLIRGRVIPQESGLLQGFAGALRPVRRKGSLVSGIVAAGSGGADQWSLPPARSGAWPPPPP